MKHLYFLNTCTCNLEKKSPEFVQHHPGHNRTRLPTRIRWRWKHQWVLLTRGRWSRTFRRWTLRAFSCHWLKKIKTPNHLDRLRTDGLKNKNESILTRQNPNSYGLLFGTHGRAEGVRRCGRFTERRSRLEKTKPWTFLVGLRVGALTSSDRAPECGLTLENETWYWTADDRRARRNRYCRSNAPRCRGWLSRIIIIGSLNVSCVYMLSVGI